MGDGRFKPGVSGNPRGRPRGLVEKRARVTNALLRNAEMIAQVVSAAAEDGDMTAASLILARAVPALKPEGSLTQFDLDVTAPLSKQIDQVMLALSQGQLTVENALSISRVLQARAEIALLERSGGDGDLVEAFKLMAQAQGRPGLPYHPPAGTAPSSASPQAPPATPAPPK